MKVCWEEMFPDELDRALAERPVAFCLCLS